MKAVLLTIILLLVLNEVFGSMHDEWLQFKTKFNKKYRSKKEDQRKFATFKRNLKEIHKHNRRFMKGIETYEKGITIFADLTEKQFDKKYALRHSTTKWYGKNYNSTTKNESVEYLDWREKGAVTPIKEQGVCGSCWIFSAVGMLEGYNFRKTGELISLSEQNVVDCFSKKSCKGGFPGNAINYVKENGISKEADYPYKERQNKCKSNIPKIKIDFDNYENFNGTEDDLKHVLEEHGPVGISLYVTGRWRLYKQGVWFDIKCSEITNHAVVLVGYGTDNGQDYWLIKNSWGKLWGEEGYIKIARNRYENYCGLTGEAMYIV